MQDHSFVRAPVIFHTIAGYDQSILEKASMPILNGLTLCIRNPSPLRNEITNTPDFWLILRSLYALPEAAGKAFDLVARVVDGHQAVVTADNYKDTVSLLNGFAAAGSVGAVIEQKRERNARGKEKPTKPAKPRYVMLSIISTFFHANGVQRKRNRRTWIPGYYHDISVD